MLSLAVVVTLGLGLGAATAIFTVSRAALLQALPYEDASRLVRLGEASIGSGQPGQTSLPTLIDWRAESRAFSRLEAYDGTNVNARVGNVATMVRGWRVTPGFFTLLGVRPSVGRTWSDTNEAAVTEVIVSQRIADHFGGEQAALGKTLSIDGSPRTIVGVLPRSFHFGDDADVWLPLTPNADQISNRSNRGLNVIGRLREGVDHTSAQMELQRTTAALAAEFPADMAGRTAVLQPLRDALLGRVKPILLSLMGAVVVLLAITVGNLGALMLLRNLDRRDELALRAALGASRGRLVRQIFMEGLLLATAGALLGCYLGGIGVRLMTTTIPDTLKIGMPYLAEARVDAPAAAAVFAAAAFLAIAFALWPAWRAARAVAPLGHGGRMTIGKGDRRLRRTLVIAQLGLTVVLLIGTTQLAGSLLNLVRQDIGVSAPDQLLTMNIAVAGPSYPDDATVQRFYEELVPRVEALPIVLSAGAVNELPLSGSGMTTMEVVGRPTPQAQRPPVALRIIAGDYFTTMGVALLEGRLVSSRDRADTPRSIVISASLAARLVADGPVLGRRIRLTRTGDTPWEVVGIVEDVHMSKLDTSSPPTAYVQHLQAAENRMPLVVRTSVAPNVAADAVRAVVQSIDPTIPVYSVATLGQQMRDSGAVFARRFPLVIGAVFAGAALLLAMLGLYSVCAHEVLSRKREFTIREVLGATPASVRMMVLRDGLALALLGICGGALLALPASQIVRSLLFGVRLADPVVYVGVALGVLVVSVVAMALPAWRGSASQLAAMLRY